MPTSRTTGARRPAKRYRSKADQNMRALRLTSRLAVSRGQVRGRPLVGGSGIGALIRLATRGGSPVTGPSRAARMSSAAAGPSAMAAGRARRRRK